MREYVTQICAGGGGALHVIMYPCYSLRLDRLGFPNMAISYGTLGAAGV